DIVLKIYNLTDVTTETKPILGAVFNSIFFLFLFNGIVLISNFTYYSDQLMHLCRVINDIDQNNKPLSWWQLLDLSKFYIVHTLFMFGFIGVMIQKGHINLIMLMMSLLSYFSFSNFIFLIDFYFTTMKLNVKFLQRIIHQLNSNNG